MRVPRVAYEKSEKKKEKQSSQCAYNRSQADNDNTTMTIIIRACL